MPLPEASKWQVGSSRYVQDAQSKESLFQGAANLWFRLLLPHMRSQDNQASQRRN